MMSTTFITTFITTFTTTLSQNFHHNFHHNSFITTLSQNFHTSFKHFPIFIATFHSQIMKDIHFNNWVTDTLSQNFHKFFDDIHYHNIHRQTLKWQIINRCINEVSQQSISMLNYSTSLLQYLHLNYWVTDSSSDYETVMKQFFITKHLITKHSLTTSSQLQQTEWQIFH